MRFKKLRFGPQLMKAAKDVAFFDQVHVIFGGSGAVGGATAFQLISIFEEALANTPGPVVNPPRVVITARTKQEIRQFTSLLYRLQQREHGRQPTVIDGVGYETARGVRVEFYTLAIDPRIPEFADISISSEGERQRMIQEFLAGGGLGPDAPVEQKAGLISSALRERLGRPFTNFLTQYREDRGLPGNQTRFRSAIVSIPLASIASYKLRDLEIACSNMGIEPGSPVTEQLKTEYLRAIRDDMAHVADELADNALAAHTTAVGGMYDEAADGSRTIRLAFAHSAIDDRLLHKHIFAEELSRLYAERGIKMLITAAAIGVDSILTHKVPPLNAEIRRQLREALSNDWHVVPEADVKAGVLRVYPPADLDLLDEPHQPVAFTHGSPLVLDYVLKSGENGFFTVSNADAIYRVMRVTSTSELGLLLARTATLGDDPNLPYFVNNICYYTETDNSRQVFDLLAHPQLIRNQVSGLQPKALQDLGSSKLQGELHMLGLLILLHRLQTLNLEMIPRHVDLSAFNPQEYFEQHSQVLTLDHVLGWDAHALSAMLLKLVTAESEADLEHLKHFYQNDPNREKAIHRILHVVLSATRAVTSISTPILYEEAGRRRVRTGYYAAPIDHVITHRDTFQTYLRGEFERLGGGDTEAFETFVEFNIANYGFADIRPLAVIVTARSPKDLRPGSVQVHRDEESFLRALSRIEPYTYFTTSGLLALLVRLRGLHRLAHEFSFEMGSANEFRTHFHFDELGRALVVPGLIEAFRMVSEGLEKNTGAERLDGRWGYYVD